MTGSGGRYVDWTHVTVVGNPAAAVPHIAEGRKMLGYVWDEAKRNNLGVHQLTRTMGDGTIIVAEKHGTIPRITIMPVEGGGDTRKNRVRGFVCKPTSDDFLDGFNADHPEAAIVSDGDEDSWATLYFDRRDPPWEDIPNPKSVYPRIGGLPGFPDGLNHYGNVDWIGKKEERLSWLGPDLRYFHGSFVQVSTKVFRAGKVLLDTNDTPYGGHVRGACIQDGSLLVATASFTQGNNSTASSTYRLLRVDLSLAPADAGLANLVADSGSAEVLWTGTHGANGDNFFFNASGTVGCFVGFVINGDLARELVTLSIAHDPGGWSASSQVTAIGGQLELHSENENALDFHSVDITEKYGTETGTTTLVDVNHYDGPHKYYTGAVGQDVLIARDFKADEPVDVTLNVSGQFVAALGRILSFAAMFYGSGEQSAGWGASTLETRVSKHCTLKLGSREIVLWDMEYSHVLSIAGAFSDDEGSYPVAEMEANATAGRADNEADLEDRADHMRMAILAGCDARFESAVVYDLEYQVIGNREGINGPGAFARALKVDHLSIRGATRQPIGTYITGVAAYESWVYSNAGQEFLDEAKDRIDDEIDNLVHVGVPRHVHGRTFPLGWGVDQYYSPSDHVPTMQKWMESSNWDEARGTTTSGGNILSALSILTLEEQFYAGADPMTTAADSVAWSNKFDPWERTAITGAHRKVHPTWVLPTTNVETEI